MTNSQSTPYFDFVNQVSAKAPVLRKEMALEVNGKVHEGVPDALEELMQQYEILQYDMMFGKQYGRQQP